MKQGISIVLLLFSVFALAKVEVLKFENTEQEQRYKGLINELRCLVCQNQNLADSNAELALDLRKKVYDMIITGSDDDQIIDYMVQRYGDFVLYRPPIKSSTIFLWVGPFIILFIAIVFLIIYARRRRQIPAEEFSKADQEKVRDILKN